MGATRHEDEVLQRGSRMFGDEARFARQSQVGTHPGRLIREDTDRHLADTFGDGAKSALILFRRHESVNRHRGRVGVVAATYVQGERGSRGQQSLAEYVDCGEQLQARREVCP